MGFQVVVAQRDKAAVVLVCKGLAVGRMEAQLDIAAPSGLVRSFFVSLRCGESRLFHHPNAFKFDITDAMLLRSRQRVEGSNNEVLGDVGVEVILQNTGDISLTVQLPQSGILHVPAGSSETEVEILPRTPRAVQLALSLPVLTNTTGRLILGTSSRTQPTYVQPNGLRFRTCRGPRVVVPL